MPTNLTESPLAVTPEMADAFAEWDAPDLPDFPVKHSSFLGWVRTAFMSGFAAACSSRDQITRGGGSNFYDRDGNLIRGERWIEVNGERWYQRSAPPDAPTDG